MVLLAKSCLLDLLINQDNGDGMAKGRAQRYVRTYEDVGLLIEAQPDGENV
jgi:hypothetical protein